jgi:type I restriction enzyme S subunit
MIKKLTTSKMMDNNKNNRAFYHGEAPEGWKVSSVGEAFEITNHLRYPISEEVRKTMKGDFPYYGPTKIQDYINEYRIEGKYALVGEDGDHFLKWRELPMTLLINGKFNVNNHAHVIKGSENTVEWFYYFFNHRELTPYLTRQGAGRYKLTKDSLRKIPILLPPLPEQRAIAACLGAWDEAIQKTSQLIAQKELRKKWLMQQLLTGKRRLKGFEGEWKKLGAGDIFKSVSVKGFDNEELLSATQDRGMIPRTMLEGRVTMPTTGTEGFKLVEKGDFVISLRSFQGGLEYSYYRGLVSPAYTVLKLKKPINDEFYKQYFKCYDFIGHLAIAVIGIRDGKQISYDDFCTVKIPYPSIEEQTAIAQVLKTADREIELLKAKVAQLKEQKRGLMQVLLTGKVRMAGGGGSEGVRV